MTNAIHEALLASETRHAEFLVKARWQVDGLVSDLFDKTVVRPRSRSASIEAEYYQRLHDENPAYQTNNWMVAEKCAVLAARPKSVLDIGCGNGAFAFAIAPEVERVLAVDWAMSPKLTDRPANVEFIRSDITREPLPRADVACSSDVLEHFAPESLYKVIGNCAAAAPLQYHVIACYDDGHSHLTVMQPSAWLALFWRFCPTVRLHRIDCRRNNSSQLVCVISNVE